MKKILILTAFALSGLAAAQDTTPAVTPPPADTNTTDTDSNKDTNTPNPNVPGNTDTAPADPSTTDSTTTDPNTTDTAPTDTAPTETAPAPTDAAPASAPMNAAPAPINAADAYARAQELAAQADVAYPVAFYDRTLWKASVDQAYLATQGGSDRAYSAYLAQLYTKTQWWVNAYNAWSKLGNLSDTEKQWAAQSAAKMAYLALQRGDKATARTYVNQGMSWANTASLQDISRQLK